MCAGRIKAVRTDAELRRTSLFYRNLHEIYFQREIAYRVVASMIHPFQGVKRGLFLGKTRRFCIFVQWMKSGPHVENSERALFSGIFGFANTLKALPP